MARPDKTAAVAELANEFRTSEGAVLTDYRGLTVKQLQELRRVLGDNASYAIVKNTLTKIAAGDAGVAGFDELLVGPTAIAFIKGDAVEVAKGLRDFARVNPPLVIKGGILDGKMLTVGEIARIADLESREVLLGRLAGAMLASLQNAAALFNAPLAQMARLAGALQDKVAADPSELRAAEAETAEAAPAKPSEAGDSVAADDPSEQAAAGPRPSEPATDPEPATEPSSTEPEPALPAEQPEPALPAEVPEPALPAEEPAPASELEPSDSAAAEPEGTPDPDQPTP
jgi:large subunit ribosomal protein L10